MLDGGVEDVRQDHEGLVDRLVAARDPPLSALVTNRAADRGRGLDPLTLDDLLAAVLVDQRDRERRPNQQRVKVEARACNPWQSVSIGPSAADASFWT